MRIIKKNLLITLAVLLISLNLEAQTTKSVLSNYFDQLAKRDQINGNVLVVEKNKIIFQKSLGMADFEQNQPLQSINVFPLASISKLFTATAVLQLKDKGKFNLDDKIKKYFPDIPYEKITIRQLLSHTSGLRDVEIFLPEIRKNPNKEFQTQEVLAILSNYKPPLLFEPNENWKYSNIGYAILALLVEKISGQSFGSYLRQNIFSVAKMSNTCLKNKTTNCQTLQLVKSYAYPFYFAEKPVLISEIPNRQVQTFLKAFGELYGNDGVVSTTEDLSNFDKALFSGKLIKKTTLEEAITPVKLNNGKFASVEKEQVQDSYYFGLGWFILKDESNGKVIYHGGTNPGCETIFLKNLAKNQTVIILDNKQNNTVRESANTANSIQNKQSYKLPKRSLVRLFAQTLMSKNLQEAKKLFNESKSLTDQFFYGEDALNDAGYEFVRAKQLEKAIEIFRLNVDLYPNSANAFDSYGESLALANRKDEAIKAYQKALEIEPNKKTSLEALKKLQ